MTTDSAAIEIWEVAKLIPYELNAKKHPPEEVEKLARAINKFGWTQPIVVDFEGVIIAGHGRRLAAIHLGRVKVPVICRRDLSKEQADALRLSDNRVTGTDYDMSMIQTELQRLESLDFDLNDLGFDAKELEFSTEDLSQMDDSVFADDVGAAVAKQQEENAARAEAIDDVAAPVADALGFKRVTIGESRRLRELFTKVEVKTGKKGVDALLVALEAAA